MSLTKTLKQNTSLDIFKVQYSIPTFFILLHWVHSSGKIPSSSFLLMIASLHIRSYNYLMSSVKLSFHREEQNYCLIYKVCTVKLPISINLISIFLHCIMKTYDSQISIKLNKLWSLMMFICWHQNKHGIC